MFFMYKIAVDILSALKKIQPITTNKNVVSIDIKSEKLGKVFPSATMFKFFLLRFARNMGIKYNAFNAPHTINVQFAPCQKPLTKKIINILKCFNNIYLKDVTLRIAGGWVWDKILGLESNDMDIAIDRYSG